MKTPFEDNKKCVSGWLRINTFKFRKHECTVHKRPERATSGQPRAARCPFRACLSEFAKLEYINNKKVRDIQELDRYRSDEILTAEIVTSPGPEYGTDVTSVIKLKTVRKTGEGWSGNVSAAYCQSAS